MWKTQQKDFSRQIEQKLSTRDFLSSFEDTLSGLLDTEVMFLLTTFANMAIARDYDVSRSFITTVVSELISIGFVNDLTSGSCGKGCRDLISNIARKHPALLSYLMEKFSQEPNLVENSVRTICTDLFWLIGILFLEAIYVCAKPNLAIDKVGLTNFFYKGIY